jgi:hypothetical protein
MLDVTNGGETALISVARRSGRSTPRFAQPSGYSSGGRRGERLQGAAVSNRRGDLEIALP